jgi:NAD+ kinase
MKLRRVMVVVKRSAVEMIRDGHNKGKGPAHMRKLLEQQHRSILALEMAHEEHLASVRQVRKELRARGLAVLERTSPPKEPLRGFDLVITVGGDGTLLAASHAVIGKTPVLGVNSAPASSVGFLTACRAPTFAQMLDALEADRVRPVPVQRLRVRIGAKDVPSPALNDALLCHDNPAMTTRYRLITPEGDEIQRSSGIWVSTPAGSTGALRSAGGMSLPLAAHAFAFTVREPYAPPGATVRFRGGALPQGSKLEIEVLSTPTSVFIDGSHRRYELSFGARVAFSLHPHPLRLVRPATPR